MQLPPPRLPRWHMRAASQRHLRQAAIRRARPGRELDLDWQLAVPTHLCRDLGTDLAVAGIVMGPKGVGQTVELVDHP